MIHVFHHRARCSERGKGDKRSQDPHAGDRDPDEAAMQLIRHYRENYSSLVVLVGLECY